MKLLIIPDAHASPAWSNGRFDWLGRFIIDEKPDHIVCLGDLADMPSLSSYDKGRRSFEGRRYKADCDATVDAQERMFAPTAQYNAERRRLKEKQYKPKKTIVMGNHSARIYKATNDAPELDGTIGPEDLQFSRFWDRVWDFGEVAVVEGFAVSHYFSSGLMGRPISGVNPARSILNKMHQSCISGHSHILDSAEGTRADGTNMVSIVAGCYVHQDFVEPWCVTSEPLWWRGVVMLEGVKDGYYEEKREITQASLRKRYG